MRRFCHEKNSSWDDLVMKRNSSWGSCHEKNSSWDDLVMKKNSSWNSSWGSHNIDACTHGTIGIAYAGYVGSRLLWAQEITGIIHCRVAEYD